MRAVGRHGMETILGLDQQDFPALNSLYFISGAMSMAGAKYIGTERQHTRLSDHS